MLWSDEDLAKLREMLDNNKSYSVNLITRKLGWGYNVDDVSGVCGAMIRTGAGGAKCDDIDADGFWRMIDEGKQLKEIAKHYGVPMVAVYKKISNGRGRKTADDAEENNKEDDDMKWTPEKTEQLLQMKGEDLTAEEIADALGCGKQAVFDKLKNIKKLNGGVLPTSHKRKYAVADVTPYKPDVEAEEETPADTPTETPPETPTERPYKVDFDVILDSVDAGKPMPEKKAKPVETVTDAVETDTGAVREPKPIDIVDLAYKAKWIAADLGFAPNHLMIDCGDVRNDIIVSGKATDGKVHEIHYSVTDAAKFRV